MRTFVLSIAALLLSAADTAPRFGWLEGSWIARTASGWTEEQWSSDKRGQLVGFGRTGQGDGARSFDFMRIAPDAEGRTTYWAQPGGRPAVAFRLVRSGESSAVFENAAHDYPQRITYRRDGPNLVATISKIDGGSAVTWVYTRR